MFESVISRFFVVIGKVVFNCSVMSNEAVVEYSGIQKCSGRLFSIVREYSVMLFGNVRDVLAYWGMMLRSIQVRMSVCARVWECSGRCFPRVRECSGMLGRVRECPGCDFRVFESCSGSSF